MKKGKCHAKFSLWGTCIVNSKGDELEERTRMCQNICYFLTCLLTLLLEFTFPTEKNLFGALQLLTTYIICYVTVNFALYVIVNAFSRSTKQ